MDYEALQDSVFSVTEDSFNETAMAVFRYQSLNCEVYRKYLSLLGPDTSKILHPSDIPYLPISFFKQFRIVSGSFKEEIVFESSSTSGTGISRHYVKHLDHYIRSARESFKTFFGDPSTYCHLALLPSYLERGQSSLVKQVDAFIKTSHYPQSAFFLYNHNALFDVLQSNEANGIPTVLWGVTYALLDFAEAYKPKLRNTLVIETGGMKGRRREMIREELHAILKEAFGMEAIAGEYGMTELMSQSYSKGNGLFRSPPWMRISVREINDPFGKPILNRSGAVNIVDLSNLHSCAFIATSDLGRVNADNSFEILGRIDHSDLRGCNLLV